MTWRETADTTDNQLNNEKREISRCYFRKNPGRTQAADGIISKIPNKFHPKTAPGRVWIRQTSNFFNFTILFFFNS
jgi:hypothetical protein